MKSQYCPDVWKGLYIEKAPDNLVHVGFCCQNALTHNVSIDDLEDVLKSKRQSYVDNYNDKQCNSCWRNDHAYSRRAQSIRWFENNDVALDELIELKTLDFNTEKLCNLACITCGPIFSSKWMTEIKKHSFDNLDKNNRVKEKYTNTLNNVEWESIDLSGLSKLYFNGGEPLLTTDHIRVLKRLDDIGRLSEVEISYNTNCTVIPSAEVLSLWKKAKLVRIMLSIDGIGETFNFVRWPGKWSAVSELVRVLNSQDYNIIIDITCVVGVHNILEIDQLIKWKMLNLNTNAQGDHVSLNFQCAGPISYGGDILSIQKADAELSAFILERAVGINDFEIWNVIESYLKNNVTEKQKNNEYISYLDEISATRGISWHKALPGLYDFTHK